MERTSVTLETDNEADAAAGAFKTVHLGVKMYLKKKKRLLKGGGVQKSDRPMAGRG